jgi:hypothetical protein
MIHIPLKKMWIFHKINRWITRNQEGVIKISCLGIEILVFMYLNA